MLPYVTLCVLPVLFFFLVTLTSSLQLTYPWGMVGAFFISLGFAFLGAKFAVPRIGALDQRTRRLMQLGFGAMGILGFVPFGFIAAIAYHTRYGTAASSASDCGPSPAVTSFTSCKGRDHSFLQGRIFYFRGEGIPDQAICRRFLATKNLDNTSTESACDPAVANGWGESDCGPLKAPAQRRCFVCSALNGSGDTYYKVFAFDENCTAVTTLVSANVPWPEISGRVDE